jgi:hypothetical protein
MRLDVESVKESPMNEPDEIRVHVEGDEIIVSLLHTAYIATFRKAPDSSHLTMTDSSPMSDPGAPVTPAQFLGLAWRAANEQARKLGWIV